MYLVYDILLYEFCQYAAVDNGATRDSTLPSFKPCFSPSFVSNPSVLSQRFFLFI